MDDARLGHVADASAPAPEAPAQVDVLVEEDRHPLGGTEDGIEAAGLAQEVGAEGSARREDEVPGLELVLLRPTAELRQAAPPVFADPAWQRNGGVEVDRAARALATPVHDR